VCQIAKIYGCKVVGIAGGEAKCRWLKEELGIDDAIDYKSAGGNGKVFQKLLRSSLKRLGARSFDIFFDNVGGMILNETLRRLSLRGRVVVCGAISSYNAKDVRKDVLGIKNYQALISLRARMEGFIVFDYRREYDTARKHLAEWISQGKLKFKEDVRDGLLNAPRALLDLFNGGNRGKLVVKVSDRITVPRGQSML
jgi:NADPH-dependent curcumin reductase